jgi:hypothetical protein
MSDYKRNIKTSQRIEYGFYQMCDQFFGRARMFKILGKRRHKFYKNLTETLKKSGEGKPVQIERVKGLSIKDFKKNYMAKGLPVVMEGAANDWPCVKEWSLDYMKKMHGSDEILYVKLQTEGYPYETITLGEVIDNMSSGGGKYYRFYPLLERHPEHVKDFDYNWLLAHKNRMNWFEAFQVFIGAKNSATGLHNANTCNVFVQVYGQKKWILYPPYYTMVLDPDPVHAYRHAPVRTEKGPFDPFNPNYNKPYELFKYIDTLEATLNPGDVLWLPPFYWHCVQNPTDSIGVSYRWMPPLYGFVVSPLYMLLDFLSTKPPLWKGYKMAKKDANLIYLAETGQLDEYLKKKAEQEATEKEKKKETQQTKTAV